MTEWLRDELMASASHKNVFATIASRAIEMKGVPKAPVGGVVDPGRFGITLQVPRMDGT